MTSYSAGQNAGDVRDKEVRQVAIAMLTVLRQR